MKIGSGIGDGPDCLAVRIICDGRMVLGLSGLAVRLSEGSELSGAVQLREVRRERVEETFSLPWGKTLQVEKRCQKVTARFLGPTGITWEVDTDILTPRPTLELARVLKYARERGVGIRLWLH